MENHFKPQLNDGFKPNDLKSYNGPWTGIQIKYIKIA